jgi:serine/threonine protein kinase
MGEVYRARDTRLDRDVAIKVLPGTLAADEERIARFEREARLLATLSHHNIAGIYGLEQTNGTRFLVLELVEGETLAERLSKGALPVEETLRLCCQMADGIAAAHERGVLHRDLKPANVKITPDDSVKVLDFGIAKAFEPGGTAASLASAPTLTKSHHTAAGTVVGTPSYMSPEQARGKALDKRTDIWSFGCVVYECLTGQTAFGGETATDAVARILERDPDFAPLPTNTPPTVQLLLRRCLQKDRKKRLHDIGDARVAIEEAIADPTGTTLGLTASSLEIATHGRRSWLPWLLAAVLAVVAGTALWGSWTTSGSTPQPALTTHLSLLSSKEEFDWDDPGFDLSPDGRMLVYVASPPAPEDAPEPPDQLFLRRFDRAESTRIAGTERAFNPAFSPDGNWIAFMSSVQSSPQNRTLKRVRLDGTPPVAIAHLTDENYWAVSWLSGETILLQGWDGKPMWATISADGGELQRVELDTSQLGDHIGVDIGSILPGGRTALGSVFRQLGTATRSDTILIELDTWACRTLLENADEPSYAASGHVVFERDRSLLAAPFDPASGGITGSVMPLMPGVGTYRVSPSGVLVYHPVAGSLAGRQLVTVDATGKAGPLSPVQRAFRTDLVISADGGWLAVMAFDSGDLPRIWAYELQTGLIRPVTPADEPCFAPRLSPDGQQLAYTKWSPEAFSVMVCPIDGSEDPRTLISLKLGDGWVFAGCWSPDGTQLLVQRWKDDNADILRIPLDGGDPVPLLASSANESAARISPDGTLLAYLSNESGERSLYVRIFDSQSASLGTRRRVTPDAGSSTVFWSHDGKTLHYIDENEHLMAATVTTDPELSVSDPKSVLDIDDLRAADDSLAPLPDGRFVFIRKGEQETEAEHLNVVLNWFDELNTKVPVR